MKVQTSTSRKIPVGPSIESLNATRPMLRDIGSTHIEANEDDNQGGRYIPLYIAVERVVERHQWLLRNSLPLLNIDTWTGILDTFNGRTEFDLKEIEIKCIGSAVLDMLGYHPEENEELESFIDRVESKTTIEIKRLLRISKSEKLAIFEAIERFWGCEGRSAKSLNSLIYGD
jgi:hypothetical protein